MFVCCFELGGDMSNIGTPLPLPYHEVVVRGVELGCGGSAGLVWVVGHVKVVVGHVVVIWKGVV